MVRKVDRKLTAAEERRYAKLREQAQNDFPAKVRSDKKSGGRIDCPAAALGSGNSRADVVRGRQSGWHSEFWNYSRHRSRSRCKVIEHRSGCQSSRLAFGTTNARPVAVQSAK